MKQSDVLDLHLTLLATWAMQTFGKAVLVAAVLPAVLAFVLAVFGVDSGTAIVVGSIAVPIVFGWVLIAAKAPLPVEVEN